MHASLPPATTLHAFFLSTLAQPPIPFQIAIDSYKIDSYKIGSVHSFGTAISIDSYKIGSVLIEGLDHKQVYVQGTPRSSRRLLRHCSSQVLIERLDHKQVYVQGTPPSSRRLLRHYSSQIKAKQVKPNGAGLLSLRFNVMLITFWDALMQLVSCAFLYRFCLCLHSGRKVYINTWSSSEAWTGGFTVLNPKGRIWTTVAGGGASVIYADTVGDLGYASELGNYAEYSGAPNEEEVLQYARVVIDCATADPDGQKRALVVGGGIANFTDVAATFNGIIRAMKEKEAKLKAANMHIYVRRGGPNYQRGLARMRALGDEIGIPIQVLIEGLDHKQVYVQGTPRSSRRLLRHCSSQVLIERLDHKQVYVHGTPPSSRRLLRHCSSQIKAKQVKPNGAGLLSLRFNVMLITFWDALMQLVLNPKGRIWTMVTGGGASVIYADTVGDLGYASELGNYAEYSGAPNEEEVLQYARVVIDCATADPDGQKRALVVRGGIANFTDVAATFNGIIRAMKEKEAKLKAANMHIYVRRGGPNYQRGLARMRALGDEIGIPIQVLIEGLDHKQVYVQGTPRSSRRLLRHCSSQVLIERLDHKQVYVQGTPPSSRRLLRHCSSQIKAKQVKPNGAGLLSLRFNVMLITFWDALMQLVSCAFLYRFCLCLHSGRKVYINTWSSSEAWTGGFTVLNPKGRIWTMVAGGGASVIYADIVGDLGYASELGNYAEYSGAPNEEEVLQYARVVIDCATADPDGQKRALVVGGGIANFTDVAATFNGIIRAMKEKEAKLKAANMHIYVRRGGPNYQRGLARMRALGDEIGIPIQVLIEGLDHKQVYVQGTPRSSRRLLRHCSSQVLIERLDHKQVYVQGTPPSSRRLLRHCSSQIKAKQVKPNGAGLLSLRFNVMLITFWDALMQLVSCAFLYRFCLCLHSGRKVYINTWSSSEAWTGGFTVLNPKGRIWTMVAGGGASVIYADIVGDLGYASELGNYAEYSGAPNEEEVLQYARVVIDCATADPDGQKRALVVGGGIANFTDVAATFNGIIRAMKEKEAKLKAANMHIYVRRGGPNYQRGLARMRALGDEIGIPIQVYGPEATMTGICKQAIDCITASA
ncbi:hypothetical protein LXL04_019832 [Taraxacum kok-saghyz]